MSSLCKLILADFPNDFVVRAALESQINGVESPYAIKNVAWRSERSIGMPEALTLNRDTILPIEFLGYGLAAARSVARIVAPCGGDEFDRNSGTGFLLEPGVLVTVNHLIPNEDVAARSKIEFDYQRGPSGRLECSATFQLDPTLGFVTSIEDDWTVVMLQPEIHREWGALKFANEMPKKYDTANIIQHPSGGPKSISLYHNWVLYADEQRVQYLTDTRPGSSGSPVFDDSWNVIAMHHSGGWMQDPGTKDKVFRNQGIASFCLKKALATKNS